MNELKRVRWAEHAECTVDKPHIQNFGCKNLRKRPLEKANCRCDDNIKIGLKTFAPRNPDGCWISNIFTFTQTMRQQNTL